MKIDNRYVLLAFSLGITLIFIMIVLITFQRDRVSDTFWISVNTAELSKLTITDETYNTVQNIFLVNDQYNFEIIKLEELLVHEIPRKVTCTSSQIECTIPFEARRSGPAGLYSLMYYTSDVNILVQDHIYISLEVKVDPNESPTEAKKKTDKRISEIVAFINLINTELESAESSCYAGTKLESLVMTEKDLNAENHLVVSVNSNFLPGYVPPYPGGQMSSMYLQLNISGNTDNLYLVETNVIPAEEDTTDYFNSKNNLSLFKIPHTKCENETYQSSPKIHFLSTWSCKLPSGAGEYIDTKVYEVKISDYNKVVNEEDKKNWILANKDKQVYEFSGHIDCPNKSDYNSN